MMEHNTEKLLSAIGDVDAAYLARAWRCWSYWAYP